MPVADRFWSKVTKTDGCWVWAASRGRQGYGHFDLDGKIEKAHRVAYQLVLGPIPDGAFILHSCDNPPCVNPAHLRVGTHVDNMRDMVERQRHPSLNKPECVNGHPYNEANTYRKPNGYRGCRTCRTAAKRAHRERMAQSKAFA